MRWNHRGKVTGMVCMLALAAAVGVVGLSSLRRAPAQSAAQTQSGGAGTVRHVWTTSQYVGRSGSSVSPDGRYLTFTDWTTGDLAVHDLVTGENRRVTNNDLFSQVPEYAEFYMQFSGDGKQLAYMWHKSPPGFRLRLINVDGSGLRFIYGEEPGQGQVAAYDWSADGKYIAAVLPKAGGTGTFQTVLIRVPDGSVRALRDVAVARPGNMSISPDGRFLAYDLAVNGEAQNRDIFVLALDIGSAQEMPAVIHPVNDRLLGWSPDGSALLFASDRAGSTGAWLQPLQDGKPQGAAQLIRANMGEGIRPLGFTRDGAFYYAASNAGQREVYTASLDLEKSAVTDWPSPAPQIRGSNEGPEWSPDGKFLAYIHRSNSIVIRSLETGEERSLTTKTIQSFGTIGWGERYLRWSPDGRQLLAPQFAPQDGTLFLLNVTTGEVSPLVTGPRSRYGRWSRDGKAVFYVFQEKLQAQLVKRNLETQLDEVLYRPDSAPGDDFFASLELSPDGRWLAFSGSDKTAGQETVLMVVSAEGGQPRLLLRVPESERVKVVGWSPDGREILFTRDLKLAPEHSTALWRIAVEGGQPRKLELGMNVLNDIRFHPDGKRVAFDSGNRAAEIWVMENFLPPLTAAK